MTFLPFEKITFKSPLTKQEAIERLSEKIDAVKHFRGFTEPKITKPYEGKIVEDKFFIKRIITYRNSFLPRIKGVIKSEDSGTTIDVKMRLHILVIIFQFIWFLIGGIGFIIFLNNSIQNHSLDSRLLVAFGLLAFAYGLTMWGFNYESSEARKDLEEIFKGEIIR